MVLIEAVVRNAQSTKLHLLAVPIADFVGDGEDLHIVLDGLLVPTKDAVGLPPGY